MDVLTRMYDHHVWLTGQIVDRLGRLDELSARERAVLDLMIAGRTDAEIAASLGVSQQPGRGVATA